MLESIENGDENFVVSFLSSDFTANWSFNIVDEIIEIEPHYTTALIYVNGEKITNPDYECFKTIIRTNKNNFINEWKNFLIEVREDLIKAGYGDELEDLYRWKE